MDIEAYNCGMVSEQLLGKNGKTILWRRFNRDDWATDHYGKKWIETTAGKRPANGEWHHLCPVV